MKSKWLNKQNNKKLIVFLAGWSFDDKPFEFLDCADYDVLFIYDYNELNLLNSLQNLENYEEKFLITWSMGVFVGYKFRQIFENFDYKIAINGTTTPVDNEFGIPIKMFELTLKYAKIGLEGKFYKNVFHTVEEFEKYSKTPVERTIDNRVTELENLYEIIKNTKTEDTNFYDFALVSEFDKIIPPKNQLNSHEKNGVKVKKLEQGHSPFYNFSSWCDIIDLCKPILSK